MSEPKLPCLCIPASRVREVLGDLQGFVGLPNPAAIDPSGYEGWSRIAIEAMRDGRIGI